MPFDKWDVVRPDGTVLVAGASYRRSAIARATGTTELSSDVASVLMAADATAPAGVTLSHQGWEVRRVWPSRDEPWHLMNRDREM